MVVAKIAIPTQHGKIVEDCFYVYSTGNEMDTQKINEELNRRFAEPLPEFYKRRIIVWHDDDREFIDKLDEITLDNAKLLELTGSNFFHAKKLLCVDDTDSNYLLYMPLAFESQEDNWLLDIELYSEEFRSDLVSIWMEEMGLPQTPALRGGMKKYRKFFNAKDRRKKVQNQGGVPTTLANLQLAIMAAIAGVKVAKPNHVIKAVLKSGLNADENKVYQEFVNYGVDADFWRMVEQGTGYQKDEPALDSMAAHILLTAATRTIRQEFLKGLEDKISVPHQSYCYDFVSDWLHDWDDYDLKEIAWAVEADLQLPQRFIKLSVTDLFDTEIFPCVHEVILVKLMRDIGENIIDDSAIKKIVEKRRTCVWYDDVQTFYEGLFQVANMQEFYKNHADGFHTVEPHRLWAEYTTDYYQMDGYYRQFHKCYAESLKAYHADLSDLFNSVVERVEGLYTNWFLGELGKCWSVACADNLREYGRILEIPRQTDFYRLKVAPADTRVYVIISDAMRYEVASTLTDELRRSTQSQVELSSMQGIFPTITKFGMAALLPHKKLSVELKSGKSERLAVLADGQSTEAGSRDKLLKNANPKSVALKYKEIIGMKRAERQALVRGSDVVYIYHDTIDEAGHMDSSIFGACDEAIDELKNMVRIITNEFSGTRVFITSDHGFLYTNSPLKEDAKVDKTTESSQDVEIGRRYAIMQKGAEPEYLLPVKLLDGETDYEGFAPRESIRIKMKGGGLNFVHGGISLQELVVPLIEYRFLRNDSKEYQRNRSKYDTKPVTLSLYSSSRKVSNMIVSLNFYQKEPVADNLEAATYQLYFTDSSGKTISDIVTVIADKTSEDVQERTFRCNFNLKSMKYDNTETYYLVIADENGLPLSREEFQIDIAFAVDEFDFFS